MESEKPSIYTADRVPGDERIRSGDFPIMKFPFLFPATLSLCGLCQAGELPSTSPESSPIEWSRRMAESEMSRRGKSLFKDGSESARWDYTSGLFAHSLMILGRETHNASMTDFASAMIGSFVDRSGRIATYQADDCNIDMILPGRALLDVWELTHDKRLETAIRTLRDQLHTHPRTSDGGFWHKRRYPWQMWLDGLYMGSPFLAQFAKSCRDSSAADDAVNQILLMDRHAYDPKSGLYFHAWDEKREQPWADKSTGCSPCFWGRSVGWYAMAVVDCLEYLPADQKRLDEVKTVLRRIADGIAKHQDPETGLWWQVLDQPRRPGNYQEASASAMFVYALAKGINHGWLPRERYQSAVIRGYHGILRDLVRGEGDSISLTSVCEVAGLGFKSASGIARDGSFGYYVSEPVVDNDLKGVGPFILAGIEVNSLVTADRKNPSSPPWSGMQGILGRIKAPAFPDRSFAITDFGASPGGDATDAIRLAIEACHSAGGGRVVIPKGDWMSGAISLKSGVNLHLAAGAVLGFSTNPLDYPIMATRWEGLECMNYCGLIHAEGEHDIAITGTGTLDGRADEETWWAWNSRKRKPALQQAARDRLNEMGENGVPVEDRKFGEGGYLRPNFIQFQHCRNILIEGVTILRSPMWEIHPVLSSNITVRGVKVSSHGPNNDGCDPECCRDVLIEDCVFDTGDDCIAIKSGRNNDGRRVGIPSENIVIRRCLMKDGHGGVVLGSEISGGARNVFVEDCVMDSPHLERALRFKSNARRGGVIENVFMRNVRIGKVGEAVLAIDFLYEEGANGEHPPVLRNVLMEDISSDGSPRVVWARGFDGAVMENVRIADSTFRNLTHDDVMEHAADIRFSNVTREAKP